MEQNKTQKKKLVEAETGVGRVSKGFMTFTWNEKFRE